MSPLASYAGQAVLSQIPFGVLRYARPFLCGIGPKKDRGAYPPPGRIATRPEPRIRLGADSGSPVREKSTERLRYHVITDY